MQRQITIRHQSPELARRLKARAQRAGKSVNAFIVEALEQVVGLTDRGERLRRYSTWSQADFDDFDKSLKAQRTIDEELWR